MIKQFDRQSLRVLRLEMQNALKAVGEKHGITLDVAAGSFDSYSYSTKVECKINSPEAVAAKPDYSELFGYPKIGTEFIMRDMRYKVVDHKPNRPKNPIVIIEMKPNGKQFKCSAQLVNVCINHVPNKPV